MVSAIFYVLRTGVPWRDLPAAFGPWSSVYTRFHRWRRSGLFARMLALVAKDADPVGLAPQPPPVRKIFQVDVLGGRMQRASWVPAALVKPRRTSSKPGPAPSAAASLTEIALERLQSISESELTRDFLIPLYYKLGYEKVEYNGGPYEQGADLICWSKNTLGRTTATVVQVKKLQISVSTRADSSFADLANQLQVALETHFAHLDGKRYPPKEVHFITPFAVTHRLLSTRFQKYETLAIRGVEIIDGPKLVELLMSHASALMERLVGTDRLFHYKMTQTLSNDVLMAALQTNDRVPIANFYCDLEFVLGRGMHSTLVSDYGPSTGIITVRVSAADLPAIEQLSAAVAGAVSSPVLLTTPVEIQAQTVACDERHARAMARAIFDTPRDSGDERSARFQFKYPRQSLNKIRDASAAVTAPPSAQTTYDVAALIAKACEPDTPIPPDLSLAVSEARLTLAQLKSARVPPETETLLRVFEKDLASLDAALTEAPKNRNYDLQLSARALHSHQRQVAEWLRNQVTYFNRGTFATAKLVAFLGECEQMFSRAERVYRLIQLNWQGKPTSAPSSAKQIIDDSQDKSAAYALRIPIDRLFDTGANIAVFGDAGAGKTTTLQMYAQRQATGANRRIPLLAPLSKVADLCDAAAAPTTLTDAEVLRIFELALDRYVAAVFGSTMSVRDITSTGPENKRLVLLDGIDEALAKAPWILRAINQYSSHHKDTQLIVSSRLSGDYVSQISFLGVTVRPFREEQRREFVRKWLGKGRQRTASEIEAHLRKHIEVRKIVRNPLLATILCTLAVNNIPLPDREIRLYEERNRLLLGAYDVQKGVRRVTSPQYLLERVAEGIAFSLHTAGVRERPSPALASMAAKSTRWNHREADIRVAVSELYDPCNVVICMNDNGDLGFGHLRFQEYFAACALHADRNIDASAYANNPWWRGVLTLYAQKVERIDFFSRAWWQIG